MLAKGLAVAADAATVVVLRCPGAAAPCGLELADRTNGAVRQVSLPAEVAGFEAGVDAGVAPSLSSDGRWLILRSTATAPGPEVAVGVEPVTTGLAVVEVSTGRVAAIEPGAVSMPPSGAFSPDGGGC